MSVTIPASHHSPLVRSRVVSDHAVPTGREEEWRFTPLARLQGLHTATLSLDGGIDVATRVEGGFHAEHVGGDDARVGKTFVPTDIVAAQAIAASDAGMILVLTGSATSDIADVMPMGLVAAGGEVIRFGMPVDPGNLLVLGRLGARPVIGLPGCARSPALNGADWVLERLACGVGVTGADIAAMGVGGLLKEIPTRPQPRARRPEA